MLDHVGIPVSDFMRSKGFYLKVLAPLGYGLVLEVASEETGGDSHAGFGAEGQARSSGSAPASLSKARCISPSSPRTGLPCRPFTRRPSRPAARTMGAPGLRPHYHENYYGAFVLDPDGHNIEAVCHLAE